MTARSNGKLRRRQERRKARIWRPPTPDEQPPPRRRIPDHLRDPAFRVPSMLGDQWTPSRDAITSIEEPPR